MKTIARNLLAIAAWAGLLCHLSPAGPPPWNNLPFYTANHVIGITVDANPNIGGVPLASGDYIGVFYDSAGRSLACSQHQPWNGTQPVVLFAYGDEPGDPKNGFALHETFRWKIWRSSDNREFEATASYDRVDTVNFPDTSAWVDGGLSRLTSLTGGGSSVSEGPAVGLRKPGLFRITSITPNPMKRSCEIRYDLPDPGQATLEIFNVTGQKIRTLIQRNLNSGSYLAAWDGNNHANQAVESGVFICRLSSPKLYSTCKIVVVR